MMTKLKKIIIKSTSAPSLKAHQHIQQLLIAAVNSEDCIICLFSEKKIKNQYNNVKNIFYLLYLCCFSFFFFLDMQNFFLRHIYHKYITNSFKITKNTQEDIFVKFHFYYWAFLKLLVVDCMFFLLLLSNFRAFQMALSGRGLNID